MAPGGAGRLTPKGFVEIDLCAFRTVGIYSFRPERSSSRLGRGMLGLVAVTRCSSIAVGGIMMPAKPTIVELEMDQLDDLLRRAEAKQLRDEDYETIRELTESYICFVQLVGAKNTTIARLRKLLFGVKTEKTATLLGGALDPASSPARDEDTGSGAPAVTNSQQDAPLPRPAGHGRNGAEAYVGGGTVDVPHESLQPGDCCPECRRGTVYDMRRPGVLVRIVGQAPVQSKVYRLQKLRCHLCGKIFTAREPEGVGPEKYDATVRSMIGLLKYGSGMPFNRMGGLQGMLGVPLPASTQWDLVSAQADRLRPVRDELIWQAAQGDVVYNDDSATSKGWRVQWETNPPGQEPKSPVAWMAGRRETE
jgi:transposase